MSSFRSEASLRIETALEPVGPGTIRALLYDFGAYPGALPSPAPSTPSNSVPSNASTGPSDALADNASDNTVHGEVHRMLDARSVLEELDGFEGYVAGHPESSLFVRAKTPVALSDGRAVEAWVYFYGQGLSGAKRIESGDYL